MLIKQYRHRLPADYDMTKIHARALKGGPAFDHRDGLVFKSFSIEEKAKHGAVENAYSSLYLWFESNPVMDFIWYEGFQNVLDTFGRPQVDMWLTIDAQAGAANSATMLYQENVAVPHGMPLKDLKALELERNRSIANDPNVVATVIGIDPKSWQISRFLLTETAIDLDDHHQAYQVAYLAQPGLHQLEKGVN